MWKIYIKKMILHDAKIMFHPCVPDKSLRVFLNAKWLFNLIKLTFKILFLIYTLYIHLSYDGTSDLATVESYDPITNSWQPEVSMGTRRSCLGVAVLHGLLYAAGGYDGASCLNRYTD